MGHKENEKNLTLVHLKFRDRQKVDCYQQSRWGRICS